MTIIPVALHPYDLNTNNYSTHSADDLNSNPMIEALNFGETQARWEP